MRSRLGSARTAWGGSQLGRTHDPLERPTAWQSTRQKRPPRGGRFGRCPDKLGGYFAWCAHSKPSSLTGSNPAFGTSSTPSLLIRTSRPASMKAAFKRSTSEKSLVCVAAHAHLQALPPLPQLGREGQFFDNLRNPGAHLGLFQVAPKAVQKQRSRSSCATSCSGAPNAFGCHVVWRLRLTCSDHRRRLNYALVNMPPALAKSLKPRHFLSVFSASSRFFSVQSIGFL